MSYREVTMYQIVCDEPDCGISTLDVNDEYAGWADHSAAADDWGNADQQIAEDGKHYCYKHRKPECCGCDSTAVVVNDEPDNSGDWYCAKCAPKEPTS